MSFSAYLVGTWENGRIPGLATLLQIVNPTTEDLHVVAAFFDNDEKPLLYLKHSKLTPNDMWEILVPVELANYKGLFGVVKIISLLPERDSTTTPSKIKEGIVGFQRHIFVENIPTKPPERETAFSEAPLAAIPKVINERTNIWQLEYDRIRHLFHL